MIGTVPAWLAFRYLLAGQYNAHRPQGVQHTDKRRAARLAAMLVESLGGSLHAPQPPGLASDSQWQAFMDAVLPMEAQHHTALMWHLWREKCAPHQWREMQALSLTLDAMMHQQSANDLGWSAETGWPKRRGPGG